jgi:5-methylcytosine-specific restriction endonuclease McrA
MSKNYICERCGKPAEIAHHKVYLTAANVLDPEISLNPKQLEAVCLACHNEIHYGNGGAIKKGLRFMPNGDITEA